MTQQDAHGSGDVPFTGAPGVAATRRGRWRSAQPAAGHAAGSRLPGGRSADRIAYSPRPEAGAAPFAVVTLLAAHERTAAESAAGTLCRMRHADSVAAAAELLRATAGGALVASPAGVVCGGAGALAALARVAHDFPRVPLAVLVADAVPPAVLVAFGRAGASVVIDVRGSAGWGAVRSTLAPLAGRTVGRLAQQLLAAQLAGCAPGARRFVDTLFDAPAGVGTVRALARRLGVVPTTLMSRFHRAGLPAPKRYLAMARLVRVAALLESPGCTVGRAADQLEYSSAQSFSRHLHLVLRLRPREFRRDYTAAVMLRRFGAELLTPYAATLARFDPFAEGAERVEPAGGQPGTVVRPPER